MFTKEKHNIQSVHHVHVTDILTAKTLSLVGQVLEHTCQDPPN